MNTAMKYIVLVWDLDGQGDGWYVYWYGVSKAKLGREYTAACKEYREVKLVEISILKEQE